MMRSRKSRKTKSNSLVLILAVIIVSGIAIYTNFFKPTEVPPLTTITQPSIKCVDGDTFWLNSEKIRLLAIDTPESTTTKEPYGKEASDYTCNLITHATTIDLAIDSGNEKDKYDRSLYWVILDGELLQYTLVRQGYAEIAYVDKSTVNQDYLKMLEDAQHEAQVEALNIWSGS